MPMGSRTNQGERKRKSAFVGHSAKRKRGTRCRTWKGQNGRPKETVSSGRVVANPVRRAKKKKGGRKAEEHYPRRHSRENAPGRVQEGNVQAALDPYDGKEL